MTMESFMDTPLVNGTAYPTFTVQRKAYRFRILNASNERYYNLQLYYVDPASPTEVKMVPAAPHPGDPTWPALWPTDGRDGGVPDPATAGPKMIQIGTEGGILPAPVVLDNTPVGYNYNRRDIVVLNVMNKTLFLGPAERADVIVDFSGVPDGSKIILYNDAGSPVPAFDTRYDYYTGDPDQTSTGGAPTTLPGYGPNTRTIMRFDVAGATAAPAFDLPRLTAALPVAFAASQPPMIVPQVADGAAKNTYAKIQDTSMTFTPLGGGASITIPMEPKTIQELFELDYGRMNSTLGVELPFTNFNTQTTIPLGFIDPPTEFIQHGVNQLWKITHNGVDTHAIHVHLFNVQLINRVGWDGAIRPPDANELGWKETVRMNPLEDAIVAFQPIEPALPFGIPVSERPMDPTMPLGSMMGFSPVDPLGNPTTTVNAMVNYGHEYVWHCHLLGHEEMDMMRPIVLQTGDVLPSAPSNLTVTVVGTTANLSWTDPTPAATSLGNPANEIGFRIERATNGGAFAPFSTALANATTSADTALLPLMYYQYRVIAYNAAGDSAPSNIADALSTVPGAPTIGTAVAGNAQATVSFSAPAFNGGKAITAYTVTSNPGGITATGVASPLTVTGLTNGTTYTFTVTATNANGTGLPSAASNSVIPATVPDAPTIGAAVRGNAQATVSFTAPAFNGGSAITAYTVTSNPGGKTATGAASPLTVTGLTNGTAYTFTVTATNVIGTSLPSTASNSVTPATVPGAPTNVTAAVASSTSATVSFTAPSANGSAITSYTVTSNPGGKIATGAAGPLTVTGLTSGSTYTFTVKATNALGTGATSSVSNSLTLTRPAAPTKLVATGSVLSVNPPTVSLSWVDNATNETGYTILRSTSTFFVAGLTTFTVAAGVTTFVDTTVLGRTSYYYRVFATNPIGSSANSNTASITTAGQLPLAPTNLTVGSITRSAITVNWIDNATTEQGFYVERSTAGTNGPWTRVATVTANKVTYTNTGLKANTSYWYRVNAYNASGVTPYTNVVTGKTLP
jgi:FtsP/CotA-like multicopper oxidase with cupredoxin domain